MRITNTMMSDQFLVDANDSLNRLAKAQEQVDSTKRINDIDDDPLATMASLKARNKLSSLAEYQSSISTANSSLKENSTELDGLNSVLQSAYELMSSANSGSKISGDLDAIREEMANLRDEVLSISDSSLGTRYLFSGDSSAKPFSVASAGGHLIYNGVDLTEYALRDETVSQLAGTQSPYTKINTRQENETKTTLEMLDSAQTTEFQSQNVLVPRIISALDGMIQSGKTAAYAATKFGAGITADHAHALNDSISALSKLKATLESENGKEAGIADQLNAARGELAELQTDPIKNADAITKKEQEIATLTSKSGNEYSRSTIDNIVKNGITDIVTGEVTVKSLSSAYHDAVAAVTAVQADMDGSISTQTALATENSAVRTIQIGTTQTVKSSLNGLELMGVSAVNIEGETDKATTKGSDSTNIYYILDKCVSILNGDLDSSLMGHMVTVLQSAQSHVLSLNTDVGTSQNRLSMISNRYVASKTNYASMQSDAEDADMAAAAVTLTTAKTVYNAALAAGAKIVQTSLVDFLH